MEEGLAYVRELDERLAYQGAADAAAIRPWFELRFLSRTAELSLLSALFRTESRAAHFREDYPATDDANWAGSVSIVPQGATFALRFVRKKATDHVA